MMNLYKSVVQWVGYVSLHAFALIPFSEAVPENIAGSSFYGSLL